MEGILSVGLTSVLVRRRRALAITSVLIGVSLLLLWVSIPRRAMPFLARYRIVSCQSMTKQELALLGDSRDQGQASTPWTSEIAATECVFAVPSRDALPVLAREAELAGYKQSAKSLVDGWHTFDQPQGDSITLIPGNRLSSLDTNENSKFSSVVWIRGPSLLDRIRGSLGF